MKTQLLKRRPTSGHAPTKTSHRHTAESDKQERQPNFLERIIIFIGGSLLIIVVAIMVLIAILAQQPNKEVTHAERESTGTHPGN
jgi:hypothetical protein